MWFLTSCTSSDNAFSILFINTGVYTLLHNHFAILIIAKNNIIWFPPAGWTQRDCVWWQRIDVWSSSTKGVSAVWVLGDGLHYNRGGTEQHQGSTGTSFQRWSFTSQVEVHKYLIKAFQVASYNHSLLLLLPSHLCLYLQSGIFQYSPIYRKSQYLEASNR